MKRIGTVRPLVAAMATIAALGGVSPWATTGPIKYLDPGEGTAYPLTATSGYSMTVPVRSRGAVYTASVVLTSAHGQSATLVRVAPIASSGNLEVVGTAAAGPHRNLGQSLGAPGFPPDLRQAPRSDYLQVAGTVVEPGDSHHDQGVDVLLGIRFRTGHQAWFDGLSVTYRVGDLTYIGEFPVSWAMCDHLPCIAPTIGTPWGPR